MDKSPIVSLIKNDDGTYTVAHLNCNYSAIMEESSAAMTTRYNVTTGSVI